VTEPLRRTQPRTSVFDGLPKLPFRPWHRLVEQRGRLVAQELEVERHFNQRGVDRERAVRADRAALAKAIAAGEAEPDDSAVAAIDLELEAMRRRHEALSVAIKTTEDELAATLDSNRGQWTSKLAALVDEKREAAKQAFTAYVTAAQTLVELEGAARFVQSFPDGRAVKLREPRLPGLLGRNGDPLGRSQVHVALAAALEPPPAPPPEQPPNTTLRPRPQVVP
jgi:hypothetical protein